MAATGAPEGGARIAERWEAAEKEAAMTTLSAEAEDVLKALETTDMGPGTTLPLHVLWAQIFDTDAVARGVAELRRAGLVICPDEISVALTQKGHDRIHGAAS
jgi:hypothetical protein